LVNELKESEPELIIITRKRYNYFLIQWHQNVHVSLPKTLGSVVTIIRLWCHRLVVQVLYKNVFKAMVSKKQNFIGTYLVPTGEWAPVPRHTQNLWGKEMVIWQWVRWHSA
jgi:hypothetical protein